jgi:hypothetical protein
VFDEDLLGSDLIGCWAMTAKWFFMNPKYNWHTSLEVETDPSCNSVMIKGWFPLAAQGHKKRGSRGEINMSLRWWYDSERISVQRKPLTALEQLTMNSDESKLRLGDVDAVINMLDTFPILFNVQHVTVRKIDFYLKDLFMGTKGQASSVDDKDKMDCITVDVIDVQNAFRLKKFQSLTLQAVQQASTKPPDKRDPDKKYEITVAAPPPALRDLQGR